MTVRAEIVHEMPGRVRARLPQYQGDAQAFMQLEQVLLETGLFSNVHGNPLTGSVVLEFSAPRDEVLAKLADHLPFQLELVARGAAPGPSKAEAGANATGGMTAAQQGRMMIGASAPNAVWVIGALFAGVGVVQLLRGQILVPALSAFWYAHHAFWLAANGSQARPGQAPHGDRR
jgi:hypothetical protein